LRAAPEHWQAEVVPSAKQKRVVLQRHFRRRQKAMKTMQASNMVASIFIGRWIPRVLFSLKERPYRHGQLRRELGNIPQRMLTRTLRHLESAGLIARSLTQSKSISVEYSLTQLGKTIIAPLAGMCQWARRYGRKVSAQVQFRKAETG
jgi:DNA-binding HxlR family transcriptional regulator